MCSISKLREDRSPAKKYIFLVSGSSKAESILAGRAGHPSEIANGPLVLSLLVFFQ